MNLVRSTVQRLRCVSSAGKTKLGSAKDAGKGQRKSRGGETGGGANWGTTQNRINIWGKEEKEKPEDSRLKARHHRDINRNPETAHVIRPLDVLRKTPVVARTSLALCRWLNTRHRYCEKMEKQRQQQHRSGREADSKLQTYGLARSGRIIAFSSALVRMHLHMSRSEATQEVDKSLRVNFSGISKLQASHIQALKCWPGHAWLDWP